MNTCQYKKEYTLKSNQNPVLNKKKEVIDNFFYQLFLSILLVLVLASVIWLKSRTLIGNEETDLILVIYTVFITLFQLFRLISAIFFRYTLQNVISDLPAQLRDSVYEPMVSYVIPCYNEEKAIENTITKSYEIDYPMEKIEVIVINDGSTDRTREIILDLQKNKFPNLKFIDFKKNKGKRYAMYEGFLKSTGEIIIQLDSDSYIVPHTFKKIVEPFKNPIIGAICAHADPDNADENWISKMQAAYYYMAFRVLKAAESTYGMVFCCSGCSSAYRRSAVIPLMERFVNEKFLGEKVIWGDDRALTCMVIEAGYKTIYTDEARAVTIVPSTFKQLMTQQTRWKKSWIINALVTGKFIWKVDPFMAFIYYYPLILISLLTPFMAVRALLYTPIFIGFSSVFFYFIGAIAITGLLVIFCKIASRDFKYWPYLFLWSTLNVFLFSFLLFYSTATIRKRTWGTR